MSVIYAVNKERLQKVAESVCLDLQRSLTRNTEKCLTTPYEDMNISYNDYLICGLLDGFKIDFKYEIKYSYIIIHAVFPKYKEHWEVIMRSLLMDMMYDFSLPRSPIRLVEDDKIIFDIDYVMPPYKEGDHEVQLPLIQIYIKEV